jgi:hypothetical protein
MRQRKQTERQLSESSKSGNARLEKTKLQRFEYREILRSQIRPAPYNPREITDYGRKLLRDGIERFGCVEPLVWNEKTGNLIAGHQRLSVLDSEEGYPENKPDYAVGVAVVSMSDTMEKQLNVLLNNPAAQGAFEKDSLFALLSEFKVEDLSDFGLTKMDLEMEFGELPEFAVAPGKEAEAPAEQPNVSETESAAEEEIRQIKERKLKARQDARSAPSNDADYYLMVCFNSRADKERFLESKRYPLETLYLSFEEWQEAMKNQPS